MPTYVMADATLSAVVSTTGAELQSLIHRPSGTELLWHGDPHWWGGQAPILFPIVGKMPTDEISIDGRRYRMNQHGFARTSQFTCLDTSTRGSRMMLQSDDATRAVYPFDFTLMVEHTITDGTLRSNAVVTNASAVSMPFSLGFHPAFYWPLATGLSRDTHTLTFERPEPSPIRRLTKEGLLDSKLYPSPVNGRTLPLHDELFADGALIFDELASHSVTFAASGGPSLQITFDGMPHLGIWTKPGAPFLCIEPWQGFATPATFDGDLGSKPGTITLPAGESRRFSIIVQVTI